jgi:hypothetical protein
VALTHELDNKESPIRRWFDARLPNAKPISKDWNERVRAVPIMRPETGGNGAGLRRRLPAQYPTGKGEQ